MIANEVRVRARRRPRCMGSGANTRNRPALVPLNLCSLILLVIMCSQALKLSTARYVHPTYQFRLGTGDDDDEGQAEPNRFARRQESDGDEDDEPDQNAAASYQNQDDGNGGGGGSGATDGYDDSEPDGPYEETPVEKEGQENLERFFDDHLGASDRDGMDKENLPSNLVSLLSEPPALGTSAPEPLRAPAGTPGSFSVMPMASVANPTVVRPAPPRPDPLQMMSTIQETSFIRLPDEKMIVTHQVTARNRPPPSPSSMVPLRPPLRMPPHEPEHEQQQQQDDEADDYRSAADAPQRAYNTHARPLFRLAPQSHARRGAQTGSHAALTGRGRRQRGDDEQPPSNLLPSAARVMGQQRRPDSLATRGSEVVATEDDDDDPVYVTNSTNKPFRIDALGGYDPEEDFMDAAKELEVMASDQRRGVPNKNRGGADRRRGARSGPAASQADDRDAWASAKADKLYGDASETDEVTFGQDDPYQTDLEAEMRQQEYDKISGWNRAPPSSAAQTSENTHRQQPESSGSSNVAVDNGNENNNSNGSGDSAEADEDIDAEVDNEYKSEPKVEQTEARSTRARSRQHSRPSSRRKDDTDDEGGWVNDGVDEMDIPSQSHQNLVLEKAAQKEEAAKKAAEEEAAAAAAAENRESKQPGGEGDQSGSTNDSGEESQRMPNADYLKNDLIEDDSGYAKAA